MIGRSAQVHVHSKAEEKDLKRELQLASTADHPNVVRHLCAYYCEDAHGDHYVWIAMEMMAHGALNAILDTGWRLWVRDAPARTGGRRHGRRQGCTVQAVQVFVRAGMHAGSGWVTDSF